MSPQKKKRIKKGCIQPVSKSKQDDGAQSLTLGENDEQSRVLSDELLELFAKEEEDHAMIKMRSVDYPCPPDVALAEASLLSRCRERAYWRRYDMPLFGYRFEDIYAEMVSYRKERNRPDEDTLNQSTQNVFRDFLLRSNSVVSKPRKRKIVKRDNGNTATRIGSDILGKGDMTSSKEITGAQDEAGEGMPGLTQPSCELPESRQNHNSNTIPEGVVPISKECDPSASGRTSDIARPSNIHLQGNLSFGSYIDGTAGPDTSHERTPTHDVVEPLKDKVESPSHEEADSWVQVASKRPHRQPLHYPSKVTAEKQDPYVFPEDDYYDKYRAEAQGHWDTMKSYKEQADTAYTKGNYKEAKDFSDQVNKWRETAEQATVRAGQNIFDYRHKEYIVDQLTIDLHGQHKKEGMEIFSLCLELGVYVRCFRQFRVITGHGSHGTGPAVLKESVIKLLGDEKIKWEYEIIIGKYKDNPGVLLIKFDREKRELDFVKCRTKALSGLKKIQVPS